MMKNIFIFITILFFTFSFFSCGSSVRIVKTYSEGLEPKPVNHPIDIFSSKDKKPYETITIAEIKCSSEEFGKYSHTKEFVEKRLWENIKTKTRKLGGDAVIYFRNEVDGVYEGDQLLSGNIFIRGYIVKKK